MVKKAIDVFAATNPALGAAVLRSFAIGYMTEESAGVPVPLMFFPLPIVLSRTLSATMDGTNVTTGLVTWLTRRPEVSLGLSGRIDATGTFTQESLAFGIRYGLLAIIEEGRVRPDDVGLRKHLRFPAKDDRGRALALASRLGAWMGRMPNAQSIFHSFGLTT
jgi:hypothetical protein